MTTIFYNGQNAFTDAIATPLVSVSNSYSYINSSLARLRTITLRGKIKKDECLGGFQDLYEKQTSLIQKFSKNFSRFEIIEDSVTIFRHDHAIVRTVTFDENSYAYMLSFEVVIDCYDYSYANNGILNPSDEISFQIPEDGTETISRSLACQAINTDTAAIDNAKSFLIGRANTLPVGINSNACLTSRTERVNRLTGEVSIILTYINDPNNRQGAGNRGVISYAFDISQDQDKIQVGVSGNISGGMDAPPTALRNAFNNINWYSLCAIEYNSVFNDGDLSDAPIQFSVTEDFSNNSISFNIAFDNISNKEAYIIDTVSISNDYITGLKCITVRLDFLIDFGCRSERWRKVQELFANTDPQEIVEEKWATYGSGPLPSVAKSKSISYDEANSTISSSLTYCSDNSEDCGCLEDFSYSLNFTPPIDKFSASQSLNGEGCYFVQDLGYQNRFRFQINGKYLPSRCCTKEEAERQLLSRINYLTSYYFPASDKIIELKSIDYNEFGLVNFSFGFNGEMSFTLPPISTAPPEDGDGIGLLLEDGFSLLQEDGNNLLLEEESGPSPSPPPAEGDLILLEMGDFALCENGDCIELG